MPEGDAVWRTARRLRALDAQTLTSADLRVPRFATADLAGATVETTLSRGKHLLTRLQPAQGPPLTLHTHLKMEGHWQVGLLGMSWRRPAHQARVVLRTAGAEAVGFALGVTELLPTAEEASVVGHLGPDLLGPDWDLSEAVDRLRADPDRAVGEALLDQSCLAGLGTVYRTEACFVAGVHPRTPVAEVPDLARLVARSQTMLAANRDRGRRSTTGDLRTGRDLWVYGRAGRPCRRCGTTIVQEQLGPPGRERISAWCPRCQPVR